MSLESTRIGGAETARRPLSFSPWPHRLAVILACATFPLLFIGGLVTSLGVGLAVPDWPTTFGYNMFLYPWSKMIGGIFYEHSHRLVASCVGLLTIALTLTLWLKEPRPWLRWLGVAALALVIFQGILGGLRVVLLQQTLAIIHACFAQAFFALTVSLALFTAKEWRNPPQSAPLTDGGRLRRLATITTVLIYVQIVFGALLRHTGERLDGHLLFAALVAVHVILLLLRITRQQGTETALLRPAYLLGGLLLGQLLLGTLSYAAKFTTVLPLPAVALVLTTTTHLIIGALMLGTSLTIALRAFRLSQPAGAAHGRPVLTQQYSL
ncbi:MAG: COX15/CtaA family protein [Candidatus Binatia bacterium]